MINTVIFDMDGTILDTIEDLRDSVNHMMRKYGYPEYTLPEIKSFVGNGVGVLIEKSVPGGRDNPLFETILAEFKAYYNEHCNIKTRPYAGIPELMRKLKEAGFKLAIVSNKPNSAVADLNELYYKEYVDVAIGEGPSLARKPAPDMVEKALSLLNSSKNEAIYIGDSEVDLATANNSGLRHILVLWGFREKEFLEKEGGKVFAKSPDEVIEIIKLA